MGAGPTSDPKLQSLSSLLLRLSSEYMQASLTRHCYGRLPVLSFSLGTSLSFPQSGTLCVYTPCTCAPLLTYQPLLTTAMPSATANIYSIDCISYIYVRMCAVVQHRVVQYLQWFVQGLSESSIIIGRIREQFHFCTIQIPIAVLQYK